MKNIKYGKNKKTKIDNVGNYYCAVMNRNLEQYDITVNIFHIKGDKFSELM